MKKTLIKEANDNFKNGEYKKAFLGYQKFKSLYPDIAETVDFNISLIAKKIDISKIEISNQNNDCVLTESKKKIAIAIHVYYLDVWDNILASLLLLKDYNIDIFITSSDTEAVKNGSKILEENFNVKYLQTENIGMDVYPFLCAVKKFGLVNYDAVLKIHTKNAKSELRALQGKLIYDSLLNEDVINHILNDPYNKNIITGIYARSTKNLMYGNGETFNKIKKICGMASQENPNNLFPAGTMFWADGNKFYPIIENFDALEEIFRGHEYKTGKDGTPAHAFERFFGVLLGDDKELSFRTGTQGEKYSVIKINDSCDLIKSICNSDSLEHLKLNSNIEPDERTLATSFIFNSSDYANIHAESSCFIKPLPPTIHALLYGEIIGLTLSDKFCSTFYKLKYPDILRSKTSTVIHYIKFGQKEGRQPFPRYIDFFEMLDNFFSIKDNNLIPLIKLDDLALINNIYHHTLSLNKKDIYEKMSHEHYKIFLAVMKKNIQYFYDHELILKNIEHANLNNAENLCETMLSEYGETKEILEAISFLRLKSCQFDKAFLSYQSFWEKRANSELKSHYLCRSFNYIIDSEVNNTSFQYLQPKIENITLKTNEKICIYTSLYGDRDELPPILTKCENVDFICFSDRDHVNSEWKICIAPPEYDDPNLDAKRFKILPHKYLAEYSASLFVDANTLLYGNLDELIKVYLLNSDFSMWQHPERSDIFDECSTIIAHGRHSPSKIISQVKAYWENGVDRNSGLAEGSFIWRRHKNKVVALFMEEWWSDILEFSKRDQVSLCYLMWKNNLKPKILPTYLGDSRSNIYFKKMPHNREGNESSNSHSKIAINPSSFTFLYSEKYKNAGSTVMRGFQLFDMLKEDLAKNFGPDQCLITSESSTIHNSCIYATKGFLQECSTETLSKIKDNNNLLIADFVDAKVSKEKLPYIDILVACSIEAYLSYKADFPSKSIFLLTHHVDPRILENYSKQIIKFSERKSIGYFGETVNAIINDKLSNIVDFYKVDTSGQDTSQVWIDDVIKYNFHYMIRRSRAIDGPKPLTKAFTAAAVDSIPILQPTVTDARFYFGHHYPFYFSSDFSLLPHFLEDIRNANDSDFPVKIGRSYLESLKARCNTQHIKYEFKRIIDAIYAERD